MTTREVRIGVIGAGYWGANLVRNCAEMGVLAAVCDSDSSVCQRLAAKFPALSLFRTVEALLASDVNAVLVAAPAQLHATIALQAIAAGKHVFVEKPLALTVPEGEQVVAAAANANVQLFVGHLMLYHPAVARLRQVIAQGTIGDVWHIRTRRTSFGKLRAHENAWWSFAPHDIALMLAITGSEPHSASASQSFSQPPHPSDIGYADFEFPDGKTAHVEVSWRDPHKTARIDVFGSRGVMTLEDTRDGSLLYLVPCGANESTGGSPRTLWREEMQQFTVPKSEPLRRELEAFVESVRHGSTPETDGKEGLAVLRALALAERAALHVPGFTIAVPR
ncbi:MAG: Gfo/Idh/MocA family oxidoreductase [Candidatus Eremiobacteraeota bacterium]|nr:Gfo/Idh/MocA family oxidoreductase [Candidatus Eremiobacteraeota bacterium]